VNYRHAFHAGNFADVHKHVVLLALLARLTEKPKPLLYLDTHAGRGCYDLRSDAAVRGGEWLDGVARMRAHTAESSEVRLYLQTLRAVQPDEWHYPGSPLLALHALREHDRAVFVEKQLQEASALQQSLRRRRGVSVVHGDGYAALKTYLPPREQRGLVLIDPPYESERELVDVVRALVFGLQRWPMGVFAIWYPIKAGAEVRRFHSALRDSGLRKLLQVELHIRPASSPLGLNGSGMLLANPPWQFEEQMQRATTELLHVLAPDAAGGVATVDWLVPE